MCKIQRPPECQILPFLFCGPFQSGSDLCQLQTHQTQPSPSPPLQVPSCTFPSLRAKHSTVHPPWEVSILSCKQRLGAHTQAHGACRPSPRLRSGSSSHRRRAPRAALTLPAVKKRGHPLLSRNSAVEALNSERVRSYRLPGVLHDTFKHFTWINSCNELLLSLTFCEWGNRGTERLKNIPRITESVRPRAGSEATVSAPQPLDQTSSLSK